MGQGTGDFSLGERWGEATSSEEIDFKWFSGWAFLVGQWLKIHLPMQKSWVQPPELERSPEKEVATLSSILAQPMMRGTWQGL